MQLRNSGTRYGAIARSLHWFSAVLVVLAWVIGVLGDELPKGRLRDLGSFVHMSAGEAIVALLLLRVVWRMLDPPPPIGAADSAPSLELTAKFVQFALYTLLILVPVWGALTVIAGGQSLPFFALFETPSPWLRDKELQDYARDVHEVFAHALIAFATLHAAAAFAHHFRHKDATLGRMLS
jgi:cytochrome b561